MGGMSVTSCILVQVHRHFRAHIVSVLRVEEWTKQQADRKQTTQPYVLENSSLNMFGRVTAMMFDVFKYKGAVLLQNVLQKQSHIYK
jgi:hypothetical protein